MVYIPSSQPTPVTNISASTTLTMPTTSEAAFPCDTTSASIAVTLPAATGSGRKLNFDWKAGSNALTFVLNGTDAYTATFPTLVVGSYFGLRDIAAGKWAIE